MRNAKPARGNKPSGRSQSMHPGKTRQGNARPGGESGRGAGGASGRAGGSAAARGGGNAPAKVRGSLPSTSSAPRGPRIEEDPLLKKSRIVMGTHSLNEALRVRPKAFQKVWVDQKWRDSSDLRDWMDALKRAQIVVEEKHDTALERFGGHQGSVAFLKAKPELDWASLERKGRSQIIFLDGIEDPHNLGAILRTAWLMDVDGVFLPQDRAVGLTPSAHKVACGGVEHVPVEVIGNFTQSVEKLKAMGYWVFGLSHKSTKSLFDLKLPEKIVWCVGAEDKGLRITTERLCDELVHIPQLDARASYNASVATALALNEGRRPGR